MRKIIGIQGSTQSLVILSRPKIRAFCKINSYREIVNARKSHLNNGDNLDTSFYSKRQICTIARREILAVHSCTCLETSHASTKW